MECHLACLCGLWELDYIPSASPEQVRRLRCGCTYCAKTDAWLVADAKGMALLRSGEALNDSTYKSRNGARYIVCSRCGLFVGSVLYVNPAEMRIAINGRLLSAGAEFSYPLEECSFHNSDAASAKLGIPMLLHYKMS